MVNFRYFGKSKDTGFSSYSSLWTIRTIHRHVSIGLSHINHRRCTIIHNKSGKSVALTCVFAAFQWTQMECPPLVASYSMLLYIFLWNSLLLLLCELDGVESQRANARTGACAIVPQRRSNPCQEERLLLIIIRSNIAQPSIHPPKPTMDRNRRSAINWIRIHICDIVHVYAWFKIISQKASGRRPILSFHLSSSTHHRLLCSFIHSSFA